MAGYLFYLLLLVSLLAGTTYLAVQVSVRILRILRGGGGGVITVAYTVILIVLVLTFYLSAKEQLFPRPGVQYPVLHLERLFTILIGGGHGG